MRIYEMTATFGKLENATLTLRPGLNIIEAPNEWGKSTWCAFLLAMLYGLDTRAKSTKTALADKERYAPWSGAPMTGRMDICWNGRDITIERKTKGRIPLGEFRAFETHTGIAVPELTAANCGATLLGVEQSVFRRAGFIRLKDMPVTQDEALRSRLNSLVTTGDESGDAEKLAKGLRELRNRCQYHRTGLIPQAEAERLGLEEKLRELEELTASQRETQNRLAWLEEQLGRLENHSRALAYDAYRQDARRVAAARTARDQALRQLEEQEALCAYLPDPGTSRERLEKLRTWKEQWSALRLEEEGLFHPSREEGSAIFPGQTGEEAVEQARRDLDTYGKLSRIGLMLALLIAGGALLAGGMLLLALKNLLFGAVCLGLGMLFLWAGLARGYMLRRRRRAIREKYGDLAPDRWMAEAAAYDGRLRAYRREILSYDAAVQRLERRKGAMLALRAELCGAESPEEAEAALRRGLAAWATLEEARREFDRAEAYLRDISALVKPVPAPAGEDELTCSEAETADRIARLRSEQQLLHSRSGQYGGRMEALGRREALESRLAEVKKRIGKLEDTYTALTIAQETLVQARMELQRRFAPRISRRAQELLSRLTQGRYDRLSLGEDLSLRAGAREETVLQDAIWRSEGTVDQLYLALRLAVAEELTPDAPLVLDDALVRFDDARLKAALEILADLAQKKQVILFTCQSRERNI